MILFEERQKFNQWWLWAILIGSLILSFASLYPLLGTEYYWGALLPCLIVLLLAAAIASFTLNTRVYEDRIEVGFTRFFTRTIYRQDIDEAAVRTYNALGEYGGWGWRRGKSGTAYNVMGNKGLQLELSSGKRLLIGTQNQEELTRAIAGYGSKNSNKAGEEPPAGAVAEKLELREIVILKQRDK